MPPSFYKKYSTFIEKNQMWITQRIGKNDKKKTARNWLFFLKNAQKVVQDWQIQVFCKEISTQNEK